MNISHIEAYEIETLVSKATNCNKSELGGIVSADWFEKRPFDAAIICITKLHRKDLSQSQIDEVNAFINTWKTAFDYPDENLNYTATMYINELKNLIDRLSFGK